VLYFKGNYRQRRGFSVKDYDYQIEINSKEKVAGKRHFFSNKKEITNRGYARAYTANAKRIQKDIIENILLITYKTQCL
jgi:NAD/NADP transhydrogenase alpha subunit